MQNAAPESLEAALAIRLHRDIAGILSNVIVRVGVVVERDPMQRQLPTLGGLKRPLIGLYEPGIVTNSRSVR